MRQLTDTVTGAVLGPLLAGDPHLPRLTWYAADGARTELSTASLGNAAAKVAGLLRDEIGAQPGDRVFVALPAGWQTAAVLLGTWWAGCAVSTDDEPDAVAAFVPDGGDPEMGTADEVFVVSGHPFGAPSRQVAAHQRDFTTAMMPQADRFVGPSVPHELPALLAGPETFSVTELLERVRTAGAALPAGSRVLSSAPWEWPDPGIGTLLAPLAVAGSLVAVHPDWATVEHLGRITTAERVTLP